MPHIHLTDLSVRSLKGSHRYVTYWDTVTPAFGVRVGKRSKTWTVMRGRTRERVSIGKYGELSLSDARKEAMRLLSEPSSGPKPIAKTFRDARSEFLEQHYADKAPRTKYNVQKLLERHFRRLEHKQLVAIDDGSIKICLDSLAATPSEQLHAYKAVRCFLRWCTRPPRRYLRHSPMEGYEPPSRDRKGTRVLSDDELRKVWLACEGYPHAVLRSMILWGTRNTETCVLERAWLADDVVIIPGAATKNGRAHSIPLRYNQCALGRWAERFPRPRNQDRIRPLTIAIDTVRSESRHRGFGDVVDLLRHYEIFSLLPKIDRE